MASMTSPYGPQNGNRMQLLGLVSPGMNGSYPDVPVVKLAPEPEPV